MAEVANSGPLSPALKRCFVVSAFGRTDDGQRRAQQVLRHLVGKALGDRYVVLRADEIDEEGLITNQIVEHLLEDELVVADLTGLNPNVFYEIAVRHAARRPIVHLITKGQDIPFDVANMRAIQYALDDPDALDAARDELVRKVRAIEKSGWEAAPNPITQARDVWLLRDSKQPETREAGDLLAAMNNLRDEVRALARRLDPPELAQPEKRRAPPFTELKEALIEEQRFELAAQMRDIERAILHGGSLPAPAEIADVLSRVDRQRAARREKK